MSLITYDPANMMTGKKLATLQRGLKKVHGDILNEWGRGRLDFFDVPFNLSAGLKIEKLAHELKKKFSRAVVVGIGGSDLGARALYQALGQDQGMELSFFSNPDPDDFAYFKPTPSEWKKTVIIAVSKSGTTLETWALFLALRHDLMRAVGHHHDKHIVIITDPTANPLRQFAHDHGYTVVDHPRRIGGGFVE